MVISMNEEQLMQAAWYERQGAAQEVIQYGKISIPQLPLSEIATVHDLQDSGQALGKVIIEIV